MYICKQRQHKFTCVIMLKRIEELIKSLGISPSQFADEIRVQRSSVSHVLSGRNKPSLDFITKIITRYPEIDPEWLLTGRGKLYSGTDDPILPGSNQPGSQASLMLSDDDEVPETDESPPEPLKSAQTSTKKTGKTINPSGHDSLEKIVFFYSNGHFREYIPE